MSTTSSKYEIKVDAVDESSWTSILNLFSDVTLYQTWAYGAVRWGESSLSHIFLERDGDVCAAAQVRIVKAPLFGSRVAYITWGPLWHRKGQQKEVDDFEAIILAIRNEYSIKRGLYVRIEPHDWTDNSTELSNRLTRHGYQTDPEKKGHHTLLLDVLPSLEDIKKGFKRKWRQDLNKALTANIQSQVGSSLDAFDKMAIVLANMIERKKHWSYVGWDIDELRVMQERLPVSQKMKVCLCEYEGQVVSAGLWSDIGNRSVFVFMATSQLGRKVHSANFLFWQQIMYIKEQGCSHWDGGVCDTNPESSIEFFKRRIGSVSVFHAGQFDVCDHGITKAIVRCADWFRKQKKVWQEKYSKSRQ